MAADKQKIHSQEIALSKIEPDKDQPRKDFGNIDGLAESIKAQGLIYPIIVTPIAQDRFRIIAGERRYMAHKKLGLPTITATVSPLTDQTHIGLLQAIENIQRKDFNPIEEARAVDRLVKSGKISQKNVAKSIGVAQSNVSQMLSILRIPNDVLEDLQTSEHVTKSALIELAKSHKKETLAIFRGKIAKLKAGGLTVIEARRRGKYTTHIKTSNYHSADNEVKIIVRARSSASLASEKEVLDNAILTLERARAKLM